MVELVTATVCTFVLFTGRGDFAVRAGKSLSLERVSQSVSRCYKLFESGLLALLQGLQAYIELMARLQQASLIL